MLLYRKYCNHDCFSSSNQTLCTQASCIWINDLPFWTLKSPETFTEWWLTDWHYFNQFQTKKNWYLDSVSWGRNIILRLLSTMHRSEREEMQERPTGYLFSKSAWSGLSKSICKREVGSGQSRICINGAIDDGHAVGSGQSRICIDGVIDGYPVELVPQPFGHHWWEWKTYEDKKDKGHEFQGGTVEREPSKVVVEFLLWLCGWICEAMLANLKEDSWPWHLPLCEWLVLSKVVCK